MFDGIPNHSNFQARPYTQTGGPLSRRSRLHPGQTAHLNLHLKTQQDDIEDAVFQTVGERKPRLGQNQAQSLSYHRNAFQAKSGIDLNDNTKTRSNKRSFVSLDNDKIDPNTQQAQDLSQKISQLESRISALENTVVENRFRSNANVSFPNTPKKMPAADAQYAAHKSDYNSLIKQLRYSTSHVADA